ncbi:rhamnogalacturonan lyase B N-terminal domain-containing protein [Microbulbifer rhizosphaerae]|uniref:rhamnogalacturonan endolyase n=1 Tax=Microbulbifer rhizosphaerae TaxID=1562603 RepID=A0A7W4WCM2_9GAMM|nr:rhamnogalacturonan lyase B N-terminal domain-containing protein [Microbulbifer rhizosphaerae]MBB3061252.1 rhamnogalacturonan endolyase [Microbulbifer rhizosphaerae]
MNKYSVPEVSFPSQGKARWQLLLPMLLLFSGLSRADFGLSSSTDFYTVDTGAGLVFKVRRTDNGVSTQSAGDIASLVYAGAEYQNQSRGSQINSGFDWLYSGVSAVTVSADTVGSDTIKVTVEAGDLTHYYMARRDQPHIYMATHFTSQPDVHGQVRYIMRLSSALLPNGPEPSDISTTVSTVESGDIFALTNGETRSKHYSNQRLKDWSYIGATGNNVGMWIFRDDHEGGSGGPFYRSLLNQTTSTNQELTYIVNYGQAQTEAFRPGILNSYTFVVTGGEAPGSRPDTDWFADMGLQGYAAPSERGRVAGVGFNGMDSGYDYTVGFANATAQYWADADPQNGGYYSRGGMRPGTYTMTVYKNELEVDVREVTVAAGGTTILNSFGVGADPSEAPAIWRIGDWDGAPREFLNGDKLTTMHPSDVRIDTWDPSNYIVGVSAAAGFPAYMWKDVNNDHIVYFKLNSDQIATAHTLRIGLTCAYAGGRPNISVNGWTSDFQPPSSQPRTRSLTTGSYRCNNTIYSFDIPASAWKQNPGEWNALMITVISGSGASGFLSAGYSVDSLDLLE